MMRQARPENVMKCETSAAIPFAGNPHPWICLQNAPVLLTLTQRTAAPATVPMRALIA